MDRKYVSWSWVESFLLLEVKILTGVHSTTFYTIYKIIFIVAIYTFWCSIHSSRGSDTRRIGLWGLHYKIYFVRIKSAILMISRRTLFQPPTGNFFFLLSSHLKHFCSIISGHSPRLMLLYNNSQKTSSSLYE